MFSIYKHLLISFFCIVFSSISFSQANHIVISEFATRGSAATDEFLELYNPTNSSVDLSGWKLEYKSATGSTWSTRANIPSGKTIASHGYFLIAPQSYVGNVTPDYTPTEWNAGIADNGNLRITDGTNAIDKVGYGTGNDPEGCDAPNHGTSQNTNSVERKALTSSTSTSMCSGGSDAVLGNGYDSDQNCSDFIVRSCGRDPQNTSSPLEPVLCDGSGNASISPSTMNGGVSSNIVFTYKKDPLQTISDLRIIFPAALSWSHNVTDISLTNATASVVIISDTILFNGITFSSDSSLLAINNVTPQDSTKSYAIPFQTKCNEFRNVSPLPSLLVFGAPIPISTVKQVDANGVPILSTQYVTIQGIASVANEFGGPGYMSDNTGGIAFFDSSVTNHISIGDEILVTGRVEPFGGLTELTHLTWHQTISQGNTVDPSATVTISQVNEDYEGQLIKISGVVVRDTFGNPIATWAVTGSGSNYRLIDATGYMDIRVDNNVDFANSPAPQDEFDVIGVISQHDVSSPYFGNYQLMPRRSSDIKSGGPLIAQNPTESNLSQTSFTISWTTHKNSSSYVKYGLTENYELGIVGNANSTRNHSVELTSLSSGTIYNIQAFSDSSGDTSYAQNIVVSTTSPNGSTGQMNAYFNKSVRSSLAYPSNNQAQGTINFIQKALSRINSAKKSIDVAVYSLSGTSQGDIIAQALIAAKARGVHVRVIGEHDNINSNAFQLLQTNGIPIIDDAFGNNDGTELMHNKFLIFDARGGMPESVWVWSGSWNLTQPGTEDDAQNVIEIQDVSLANAYTREFEEMWGSTSDVPNSSNSHFGVRKTNNTPHRFIIGGNAVESYFSPSDKATTRLKGLIKSATHDVEGNIYSFTRGDVADSIISIKNAGRKVRLNMDNNTDAGNEYQHLLDNGVDVKLKVNLSGLLHHKLMLIDALKTHTQQWTWTGSMNWTNNGEQSNDENSIAIQNNLITNQYVQEFAQRYYDFGGSDSLRIDSTNSVKENPTSPFAVSLDQNYPNPFNPTTMISFSIAHSQLVTLKVYNILGQEVSTLLDNKFEEAGLHEFSFDASLLTSGMYIYRLTTGTISVSKTMMFIK